MDKILALIYEEANRRPGKRVVPKLSQVKMEMDVMVSNLIMELLDAERKLRPNEDLQREDSNNIPGKQP